MKKFCNKIAKQQWRMSIPNLNGSLFKKASPGKESPPGEEGVATVGSYDLVHAEPTPISCVVESDTSDDTDNYEDAAGSVKHASVAQSADEDDDHHVEEEEEEEEDHDEDDDDDVNTVDANVYADVEPKETLDIIEEADSPRSSAEYEYDVPRISFSFFEENSADADDDDQPHQLYEVLNVKKPPSPSPKHKSEIKIRLSMPSEMLELEGMDQQTDDPETEMKIIDVYLTKSLEEASLNSMFKSGSESNIPTAARNSNISCGGGGAAATDDDEVYKVPGQVRRYRLSMSLTDFNEPDGREDSLSSASSSIDHISCSQVLAHKAQTEPDVTDSRNSASMDYCKVRSKLPAKIRRATLLRRPKNMAVGDTWVNFKSRFNKIVTTHATGQRVGAYAGKEKLSINIEELYKNSRSKCRDMLRKSTGKLFRKRETPSLTASSERDNASIVKNDAFFAKVDDHQNKCDENVDDRISNNERSKKAQEIYNNCSDVSSGGDNSVGVVNGLTLSRSASDDRPMEFDFNTLKSALRRSRLFTEVKGQNGFDDLRRYVKQGGDFCKELAVILQERSEAEIQYAKSLSKLSGKLARACREGVGGLNDAWRSVAVEMEGRAEIHRVLGGSLLEECARPLRQLTETQHRARKQSEAAADKAAKGLSEWRTAEAKSKKHSHACARDNEKLQDALLDVRLSRSSSLIQLTHAHKNVSDKENAKLEGKKRKAEDAVKKADIEYYTLCVRAERARLEWESAVLRGSSTFQTLEEERLNNLKAILASYMHHSSELGPRHNEHTDRLKAPASQADPAKDLITFSNLKQTSHQVAEQLLPDFYCEHITLAMNRERRKQALVKLLQLVRQDIERERKSKNGLENLSKAIKQTPNFGNEDSQQNVTEKLYHMRSMLTYLEGARYKVQSALAELDSRPRGGHPLAGHITITRDKSGLQQSILKVPHWLREEWPDPEKSPISEKNEIAVSEVDPGDWLDRGTADGNSNQPDSDFDEFSSQASSTGVGPNVEDSPVQPVAHCRALYAYTANLPDELTLKPGDKLSVYRQQEDGWWLGECGGNVGIFPATYVETIPT